MAEKNIYELLDDEINSQFDSVIDLSKIDGKVDTWYDSGIYSLNYAMSKNLRFGLPAGRIISYKGLSSTGKSLLGATAMKDPQLDMIMIIETEGGGNAKELIEFAGVDPKKVRILKAHTFMSYKKNKKTGAVEEVAHDKFPKKKDTPDYSYVEGATYLLKKLVDALDFNPKLKEAKILILLDSLGNLQSVRELSGTCYLGDTLVSVRGGHKKIKDVVAGDMVLTHLSSYAKVLETKVFKDKDEIVEIEFENETLKLTPNHRLLVERDEVIQWLAAGELTLTDLLLKIEQ